MRRLAPLLLAALLLAGCLAPEVKFTGPGCGGALVAPEAVVSVAHCFTRTLPPYAMRLPSGLDIYALPIDWNAGNDLVLMRPILQTGEPLYILWPWYAEYQEPELHQLALIRGGCRTREIANYRLRYLGEATIPVTPYPIQPGIWDHWVILDGVHACPGDSGFPLWTATGPANGAWPYFGVFSLWRGWSLAEGNGEIFGQMVISTGALSDGEGE